MWGASFLLAAHQCHSHCWLWWWWWCWSCSRVMLWEIYVLEENIMLFFNSKWDYIVNGLFVVRHDPIDLPKVENSYFLSIHICGYSFTRDLLPSFTGICQTFTRAYYCWNTSITFGKIHSSIALAETSLLWMSLRARRESFSLSIF